VVEPDPDSYDHLHSIPRGVEAVVIGTSPEIADEMREFAELGIEHVLDSPAAAKQESDPRSMLSLYRRLFALRREYADLAVGELTALRADDGNALVRAPRQIPPRDRRAVERRYGTG
jgi:hypothetical protein